MGKIRKIEVNNYYHDYSRGVNKFEIFRDHSDYSMFQRMIKLFNTDQKINLDRPKTIKKGKKLVDVFCYTLMPNHFHFILKELVVGGTSKFLQKVLGQYANYFNRKYGRTGSLFGQRFKDKLVDSDQYFEHLVGYIWNNPIKLIRPDYNSKDLFNGVIELTPEEKEFAEMYSYKKFPENYQGPEHKKLTKTNFEPFDF